MLILSKDADVIFYLVLFCFVFFILSSIPCGGPGFVCCSTFVIKLVTVFFVNRLSIDEIPSNIHFAIL